MYYDILPAMIRKIITNPTTILYQPKTLNPFLVKNWIKLLMAIKATTKATAFPNKSIPIFSLFSAS
jgi:hypothetical protein